MKRWISALLSLIAISTTPISAEAVEITKSEQVFDIHSEDSDTITIISTPNTYMIQGVSDFTYSNNDRYDIFEIASPCEVTLFPTGKIRENTEVCINSHYYIIHETKVNGYNIRGDLNYDNRVNLADLVMAQNYQLGKLCPDEMTVHRLDVNTDGVTDIFDIVYLRNQLLEELI